MRRSSTETFLAFKHRRDGDEPEFEVAIEPDYALEIDQRNNWRDERDADHDQEVRDELLKIGAKGTNELMMLCFKDNPITKHGRGMTLVIQRFIAVAHLINGDVLSASGSGGGCRRFKPGPPPKLRELAELVGSTPSQLRTMQRAYLKAWGLRLHVCPLSRKRK